MQPITREEFAGLMKEARISRRLQRELRFVPEEITDWKSLDFLPITNKSGTEGILIIPEGRIIPFSLYDRTANAKGRVEAIICDICATWQRGTHSQILTLEKSTKSASFLVCEGLKCSQHVRGKTTEAALSRAQLPENMTVEQRIARLKERLLFIIE